jgi:hypothetical protein
VVIRASLGPGQRVVVVDPEDDPADAADPVVVVVRRASVVVVAADVPDGREAVPDDRPANLAAKSVPSTIRMLAPLRVGTGKGLTIGTTALSGRLSDRDSTVASATNPDVYWTVVIVESVAVVSVAVRTL